MDIFEESEKQVLSKAQKIRKKTQKPVNFNQQNPKKRFKIKKINTETSNEVNNLCSDSEYEHRNTFRAEKNGSDEIITDF